VEGRFIQKGFSFRNFATRQKTQTGILANATLVKERASI